MIAQGLAEVIFLGKREETLAEAEKLGLKNLDKAEFHSPDDKAFTEKYAELFKELRKKKGVSLEDARYTVKNPLYLGCLMIKAGDADCMVTRRAKPHIKRASRCLPGAFKTRPGISVVSGAFIMLLPENVPYGDEHMLIFCRLCRGARPDS